MTFTPPATARTARSAEGQAQEPQAVIRVARDGTFERAMTTARFRHSAVIFLEKTRTTTEAAHARRSAGAASAIRYLNNNRSSSDFYGNLGAGSSACLGLAYRPGFPGFAYSRHIALSRRRPRNYIILHNHRDSQTPEMAQEPLDADAAMEIMIMVSLEVALMRMPFRFSDRFGVNTPSPPPAATMMAFLPTVAVTVLLSTAVFSVAPTPTLPPLTESPPATS
jgi:hypothetical protein